MRHNIFSMGTFYFLLALLIQNALTETNLSNDDNNLEILEIFKLKPEDDKNGPKDWMDLIIGSNSNVFPTSSAALMAQAALSDKAPEEQLEEIKRMASEITKAIQSEMANLLSYATSIAEKESPDNTLRNKRSVETPLDSTQLVMRLLKHIKSNNEYQNIAIEKMMSAQEIADKFGIEFNPDPEMLSDLAVAANEHTKEMSHILKDACHQKNTTQVKNENVLDYVTKKLTECSESVVKNITSNTPPLHDHIIYIEPGLNNGADFSKYNHYFSYPYESQIAPTPVHQHPVTSKPSFYDYVSMSPTQEYYPYCSVEPTTTVVFPMDEPSVPEEDLIGEEYEETVSSKVCVDHEEPGVSTVNHVMTYTLSEKAHFRTPQIDSLPQQMQYYFFLM